MPEQKKDWRPIEFDGLVVENPRGDRIIALPIAVLEVLRYASVIRYKRGGSVWNMRLTEHTEFAPPATLAQDAVADAVREVQQQAANDAGAVASWSAAGSAPTPEYGAPALPVHGANDPSPTPPPTEGDPLDPANIPLRVHRAGQWTTVYVTREQYEQYTEQGRIAQEPPEETQS